MSRTYMGWSVERYRSSDSVCCWRAWKLGELPLKADTLDGLKSLIRYYRLEAR